MNYPTGLRASIGKRAGSWATPSSQHFICALVAATAPGRFAQDTVRSGQLYDELARMDTALFDAAFISCSADKFRAIFTEDAEFYHDRTGASYGESVRTLKSCPRDTGVTRTLVPGSLEVYPMQGYGAIQMGRHTFARAGESGSEVAPMTERVCRDHLNPLAGRFIEALSLAAPDVPQAEWFWRHTFMAHSVVLTASVVS